MNTSFERDEQKDEWLTPPHIMAALGEFDLDPCAPINRPWPTATTHFTVVDDGLNSDWEGRVFCNPPYGRETQKWLNKCAEHGNCIALHWCLPAQKPACSLIQFGREQLGYSLSKVD